MLKCRSLISIEINNTCCKVTTDATRSVPLSGACTGAPESSINRGSIFQVPSNLFMNPVLASRYFTCKDTQHEATCNLNPYGAHQLHQQHEKTEDEQPMRSADLRKGRLIIPCVCSDPGPPKHRHSKCQRATETSKSLAAPTPLAGDCHHLPTPSGTSRPSEAKEDFLRTITESANSHILQFKILKEHEA